MDSRKRVEKPSQIQTFMAWVEVNGEQRFLKLVRFEDYNTLFQAALYGTDKYCNNVKGFLVSVLKSMGERYWYRDKDRRWT